MTGLSIAWAVVEYISNKEKCGAKTLFATHYHELTELEEQIEGVKNYSIAVKEKGEDVIFLRKIVKRWNRRKLWCTCCKACRSSTRCCQKVE